MAMADRETRNRNSDLCYLDASRVESPAGALSDLDVLTADGERFGRIAGVVIEPAAQRVRYFDVRQSGWFSRKRCFLEADQLAQLDSERRALRLLSDDTAQQAAPLNADAL